jgi:hypothetical protein
VTGRERNHGCGRSVRFVHLYHGRQSTARQPPNTVNLLTARV